MKEYEVKLTISAPNEEAIHKMIDSMRNADSVWDVDIVDPDEKRFEERIRYDENYNGRGEYFVFEGKYTDEDEWGLDTAYGLNNDRISYQALTKIRELIKHGTPFRFA